VEHLPQRLCRLEAVARGERHPPFRDLLRGQLGDATVAEDSERLPEKPAQLLDRHRLHVMLREIRLDELGQCQRA